MSREARLRPLAQAVLRTQSDDRLVALAREGREAAFAEIVRRYRPGLVAFAAAYAPRDRIEDVVQESLVRSWRALGHATEEIHLKPWLYTIVRNRALNARRDAKPHEPLSEEIDGVPQPPDIVLEREELDAVVGAVNALPEQQRQALVRSALEGHTHEQIAAALGSSPGAVRQLIYRARLNLRTGVGMLIPLPLVRVLAEHGAETGVTAGGIAAGGAALGAAGGASALSKVALVAAIGTAAAGAGVAIEQATDDRNRGKVVVEQRSEARDRPGPRQGSAPPLGEDPSGPGPGGASAVGSGGDRDESESDDSGAGSDDSGSGGDDSGPGSDDSGPSSSSGPSPEPDDDDRSGSGGGDLDDDGSNSGPGGGDDSPDFDDDNSGSGSSSSGSGSRSSGGHSGSDDDNDDTAPVITQPDDGDNSGSGGGGSGSGSSGSGSGDDDFDHDDFDD